MSPQLVLGDLLLEMAPGPVYVLSTLSTVTALFSLRGSEKACSKKRKRLSNLDSALPKILYRKPTPLAFPKHLLTAREGLSYSDQLGCQVEKRKPRDASKCPGEATQPPGKKVGVRSRRPGLQPGLVETGGTTPGKSRHLSEPLSPPNTGVTPAPALQNTMNGRLSPRGLL